MAVFMSKLYSSSQLRTRSRFLSTSLKNCIQTKNLNYRLASSNINYLVSCERGFLIYFPEAQFLPLIQYITVHGDLSSPWYSPRPAVGCLWSVFQYLTPALRPDPQTSEACSSYRSRKEKYSGMLFWRHIFSNTSCTHIHTHIYTCSLLTRYIDRFKPKSEWY